jgi:hypothetical protein
LGKKYWVFWGKNWVKFWGFWSGRLEGTNKAVLGMNWRVFEVWDCFEAKKKGVVQLGVYDQEIIWRANLRVVLGF